MTPAQPGRLVAIHQPNFFPWLGYFDKIARADVFVILDTVQHQKKAGNWSNRVKLLISGEARWVSAPIDRNFHGVRNVNEIRFGGNEDWRSTLVRTLQANYARAPFYEEASALIVPLIRNTDEGLADYNGAAILAIAGALGIDTGKIRPASGMAGEGAANELLVSLTRQAGGTAYLCGGGAAGYQDERVFADVGIALVHQDYQCPAYPQHANSGEFVPGLSVIDSLMNVGISGTKALLTQGQSGG